MEKLDKAEQNERQRDTKPSVHTDSVAAPNFSNLLQSKGEIVKDSMLDMLGDESFEDFPPSQGQLHRQILQNSGVKASRPTHRCRNIMDQLKRTMVFNAASPSSLSRTIVLKEAVVSEEISVAMQAIETVSAETTDLGPFFGLPTKVKDLMHSLRGIKDLYGIILSLNFSLCYPNGFHPHS